MKAVSRWWAVAGSDPLWWVALPFVIAAAIFGAALWIVASVLRALGDAADFFDRVGGAPMHAIWTMRQQRAMRRQNAWSAKCKEPREVGSHEAALRKLAQQDGERP